jgi:diacylglycerol kinase (ATP)
MRKAALLFNARSGGRHNHRERDLERALEILSGAGVETELVRTQSSQDASNQARKAVAEGCDTVFACGGDGTVHDVLQAMVGSGAALGIVPMGTANALAHDLGLPLEPSRAVRAALSAVSRRIAVGRIIARGPDGTPVSRFFTVAVGVGVDAHLFYKLQTSTKQKLGMAAYYAKAWNLWFTHRMERFRVQWSTGGQAPEVSETVTELLAVRIRNFGGVLRELAPGAALERNDLRLVICRTSSRISYLLYVLRGLLGQRWSVPGVDLVSVDSASCSHALEAQASGLGSEIYVEADGELLGTLPAEITIVPDALTILAPRP